MNMIGELNEALSSFLNGDLFNWIFSILIFINPLAVIPQLRMVLRSEPENLHAVSVWMFAIFASIQLVSGLYGIKTQSLALFLSMAISFIESIAIIGIVLYRRG